MTADTSLRNIREVAGDEDDNDGDIVDAEEEEENKDIEEDVVSTPMGSLTSTITPLRGEAFLLRT